MGATFLVCHGAWSAGWAWKKMHPLMAAAGLGFWDGESPGPLWGVPEADRVVVLADGEVITDGPTREVVCHTSRLDLLPDELGPAVALADAIAPEHLEIATAEPEILLGKVRHALIDPGTR